jgi:flavin reductase (DIM6/NTAB) family NADH-FMN oxidoreductase RutF
VVAECPVSLECRVIHRLPLGTHDVFIGQVLAVQVDEALLGDNGRPDYARAEPLAYVGGEYWRLEAVLGGYGDWRPRVRER